MRTASALIIGAAAFLQLNGFAFAETCDSYVDYSDNSSLCGPTGVKTSDIPADITCSDPLVCTFAECCEAETCETAYAYGSACGSNGVRTDGTGGIPAGLDCAGAACTFTECCNAENCDHYTVDGTDTGSPECPNGFKTNPGAILCDGPDGACTFDTCCAANECSEWPGHTSNSGTACADAGVTQLQDATTQCAGEDCTIFDCCTPTCATGKGDKSGDPFVCPSFEAILTEKLDFDCGDQAAGGGDEICIDTECCGAGIAYCGDGAFTCSVAGEGVPAANFAKICTNECDDAECGCTVVAVTCRQELHSCSAGTRIDTNSCPDGIGTCTDALCCEPPTESTISEARMMRTPRSRISATQYGA